MKTIDINKYQRAMDVLLGQLNLIKHQIDAIVCIKRSGFILGVYLSNKMTKPLFTQSEIDSIPNKFKNILLVDDKIQSGATMNKYYCKLKRKGFNNIRTASLFIEGTTLTEYFSNYLGYRIKPWYEN